MGGQQSGIIVTVNNRNYVIEYKENLIGINIQAEQVGQEIVSGFSVRTISNSHLQLESFTDSKFHIHADNFSSENLENDKGIFDTITRLEFYNSLEDRLFTVPVFNGVYYNRESEYNAISHTTETYIPHYMLTPTDSYTTLRFESEKIHPELFRSLLMRLLGVHRRFIGVTDGQNNKYKLLLNISKDDLTGEHTLVKTEFLTYEVEQSMIELGLIDCTEYYDFTYNGLLNKKEHYKALKIKTNITGKSDLDRITEINSVIMNMIPSILKIKFYDNLEHNSQINDIIIPVNLGVQLGIQLDYKPTQYEEMAINYIHSKTYNKDAQKEYKKWLTFLLLD